MTSVFAHFKDGIDICYEPEAISGKRSLNSLDQLIQELIDVSSDALTPNLPKWRIVSNGAMITFWLLHPLMVEVTNVDFEQEKSVVTIHFCKKHIGKPKKKANCHTWRNTTSETDGTTLEIYFADKILIHAGNWGETTAASISFKVNLPCLYTKDQYKEMIRDMLEVAYNELTQPCPEGPSKQT